MVDGPLRGMGFSLFRVSEREATSSFGRRRLEEEVSCYQR